MLLCYYVYNFVNEEKHVEFILKISGIGMAIVTVIGKFWKTFDHKSWMVEEFKRADI